MNTVIGIVLGVIVLGGILYSQDMRKTDRGFVVKSAVVHTYYQSNIVWGDNYLDHDYKDPVHNTEVMAFGDGWQFSTTTDDKGMFMVEVKPGVPFKIKASDGNVWIISEEQAAILRGETFDDRGKDES